MPSGCNNQTTHRGCHPEKEPAKVVFRRAKAIVRSMAQRDICVHDLLHATTKVVKIRQKCKKIRQNRISMPYFF